MSGAATGARSIDERIPEHLRARTVPDGRRLLRFVKLMPAMFSAECSRPLLGALEPSTVEKELAKAEGSEVGFSVWDLGLCSAKDAAEAAALGLGYERYCWLVDDIHALGQLDGVQQLRACSTPRVPAPFAADGAHCDVFGFARPPGVPRSAFEQMKRRVLDALHRLD